MSDLLCHLIFHEGIVAEVKVGLSIRESIIYIIVCPTCFWRWLLFFFDLNDLPVVGFEWLLIERAGTVTQLTYDRRLWSATSTFCGVLNFVGALLSAINALIRNLFSFRWSSEHLVMMQFGGIILLEVWRLELARNSFHLLIRATFIVRTVLFFDFADLS